MRNFGRPAGDPLERTRRQFVQLGGAAAWSTSLLTAANAGIDPRLHEAIAKLEYLTPLERAFILDKGKADAGKRSGANAIHRVDLVVGHGCFSEKCT